MFFFCYFYYYFILLLLSLKNLVLFTSLPNRGVTSVWTGVDMSTPLLPDMLFVGLMQSQ